MVQNNLIIDVDMHRGLDTEFYLNKGFNVASIEANPELVAQAQVKFADHIKNGRLKIYNVAIGDKYNVAIGDKDGAIDFFVNEEKDDWSSTYEEVGGRENTRFHKETI